MTPPPVLAGGLYCGYSGRPKRAAMAIAATPRIADFQVVVGAIAKVYAFNICVSFFGGPSPSSYGV